MRFIQNIIIVVIDKLYGRFNSYYCIDETDGACVRLTIDINL